MVKTRELAQDQVIEWLREGLCQLQGLVLSFFLFGEVLLPSHPSFISVFILVCFEFEFDLDHFPPTYTSIGEGNIENDYYRVLKHIIQIESIGEPLKRCVLFSCEWFDPASNRGTPPHKLSNLIELSF